MHETSVSGKAKDGTIGGRSREMVLAKQLEPFVEDELLEGLEARVRDPSQRLAHLRGLCGGQASLEIEEELASQYWAINTGVSPWHSWCWPSLSLSLSFSLSLSRSEHLQVQDRDYAQ